MDASSELRVRLREIDDLEKCAALLYWDQATKMPAAAAESRGRRMGMLQCLAHDRLTDPKLARLLHRAEQNAGAGDEALLRIARRDIERATRIPRQLVDAMTEHQAKAYMVWTQARPANDFATLAPILRKTLDLTRRKVDCFPAAEHPLDPLIDEADPGMTAGQVRHLFERFRTRLVPLIAAIAEKPPIDDSCLKGHFPAFLQLAAAEDIIRELGYDFDRGRSDPTHHPFMIRLDAHDIRITTRVNEAFLREGIFGTIHEAGHAIYEQGIDPALEGTPLATGTSCGVHESQSRLWENLIGRSRPFWHHFYPLLAKVFPAQLAAVPEERFHRAINRVQPSLIRVDADELTYNLHIMIRFDLEDALLSDTLSIDELPEAWNARYAADLGVTPPDFRDGVLQDVHWFVHTIGGYFQGYALGNLIGAQLLATARQIMPDLDEDLAAGRFAPLRAWLTEAVYRHGRGRDPHDLVQEVTGKPLDIDDYVTYARSKYAELYGLQPEAFS